MSLLQRKVAQVIDRCIWGNNHPTYGGCRLPNFSGLLFSMAPKQGRYTTECALSLERARGHSAMADHLHLESRLYLEALSVVKYYQPPPQACCSARHWGHCISGCKSSYKLGLKGGACHFVKVCLCMSLSRQSLDHWLWELWKPYHLMSCIS